MPNKIKLDAITPKIKYLKAASLNQFPETKEIIGKTYKTKLCNSKLT